MPARRNGCCSDHWTMAITSKLTPSSPELARARRRQLRAVLSSARELQDRRALEAELKQLDEAVARGAAAGAVEVAQSAIADHEEDPPEAAIDTTLEGTFPASDPPSWTPGNVG